MIGEDFIVYSASVAGTDHTKPFNPGETNNQDAISIITTPNLIIGVVADGCGSGKHNEVGSNLGARIFAGTLAESMSQKLAPQIRLETVASDTISKLVAICSVSYYNSKFVEDFMLFTIIGFWINDDETVLFSIGDGVVAINDDIYIIEPLSGNRPPYLGYGIKGSPLLEQYPDLLRPVIHWSNSTDQVRNLMIGSDGIVDLIDAADSKFPGQEITVGELSQFWTNGSYASNPVLMQRKLNMCNRSNAIIKDGNILKLRGLLKDDTTMVVVRRKP